MFKYQEIKKTLAKPLVRDTIIYGATNALYSGLPILLMPFLLSVLNPQEYGIVELFRSTCLVLTPILGLSTIQSIGRFYYDLHEIRFKAYVSSILIFHLASFIFGVIVITVFSFLIEEKYKIVAYLTVIYFFFNQITEALLVIFRVEKKAKKYLLIRVFSVIVDVGLLVVFYYLLTSYDYLYRIVPNTIGTIVTGLICIVVFIKKRYKFVFNKRLFCFAFLYSYPLILHMLSGYILNIGDRFLILHFLNEKELGNYSVAYQLGMGVNFFYTSFNLAWTPTFYEWMKQKKVKNIEKARVFIVIALLILGVLTLGCLGLLKSINNFSAYDVPYSIVMMIVISYIFISLYKFNANYFMYYKNTKVLSVITLISAIITLSLNILLLPIIGIEGAAIATLVSSVFMYFATKIKLRNEEKIIKN